ncbi:hypothetical protein BH23CHL8_BH23CHL8_00930 [soil metagenome]
MSTREAPGAVVRRVVMLLAVVVLLAIDGPASGTAEAANLSGTISSVRRAQISAEASMRQADGQIKSLKRDRRVARKRIKAATARLARLRERRGQARERADARAEQLALAHLRLRLEFDPPPAMPGTHMGSALGNIAESADASLGDEAAGAVVADLMPAAAGPKGTDAGASPGSSQEIRQLESDARRARTSVRRFERKTRRLERARAALVRSVPRFRHQMAAAASRKRGHEATLAHYIKSMSSLAHKRVAKKTKVKNMSGFAWPIRARISQGYHRGHDGLDLVASRGAPIRAMAIGVVAYVGWNPWDQGRRAFVVVIAHPGGYETVYGHLLPIRRVTVGHLVRKGQLIGYMGNTGHSTGVHLHIEVRRGFRTINPLSVL